MSMFRKILEANFMHVYLSLIFGLFLLNIEDDIQDMLLNKSSCSYKISSKQSRILIVTELTILAEDLKLE